MKTGTSRIISLAGLALLATSLSTSAQATGYHNWGGHSWGGYNLPIQQPKSIETDFEQSKDGWTTSGQATSATRVTGVNWYGNSSAFLSATDKGNDVWYFEAPAQNDDLSDYYGGSLMFDYLTHPGSPFEYNAQIGGSLAASDLILSGNGIELTLSNVFDNLDFNDWVTFNILFDTTQGWKNGGNDATEQDLKSVLASLTRLAIRGDLFYGVETGKLDNIKLVPVDPSPVPLPAALWLFGSALAGFFSLQRKKV